MQNKHTTEVPPTNILLSPGNLKNYTLLLVDGGERSRHQKWKRDEETYLLRHNVVDRKSTYFNTKLNKFVIDNRTLSQENKKINILKVNFPSTHIHLTYKS